MAEIKDAEDKRPDRHEDDMREREDHEPCERERRQDFDQVRGPERRTAVATSEPMMMMSMPVVLLVTLRGFRLSVIDRKIFANTYAKLGHPGLL
jgi:hypothetical protein